MSGAADRQFPERLEAGVRRIPPEAWPFVLVAVLVFALNAGDLLGSGIELRTSLVILASIVVGPLLPAAVLVGCRDAWTSARPLLMGALIWAAIGPLVSLLAALTRFAVPETWPDTPVSDAMTVVRDLGILISFAGPAIVAYALAQRRRTETTWPLPLVAAGLVAAAALSVSAFVTSSPSFDAALAGFYGDGLLAFASQLDTAILVARPIEYLGLGALAWSSLSAVRAGEVPRRFWKWVLAGSATLVACEVGLSILQLSGSSRTDTSGLINELAFFVGPLGVLAAYIVLVVGFGSGLPADPDGQPELTAA